MPRNIFRSIFIIILIAFSATYAQTLLNEGFEGTTFPPLGWITYDNVLDYWVNDRNGPHVASGCAFAGKFGGNPHTPSDAWLVTPRLQPTAGHNTLEFWARGFNRNHFESLQVWISRAGTDKASFTTSGTGVLVAAIGMRTWDYTKYTFSLASYDNQLIYVGFQYVGVNTNRHGIFLDDISDNGGGGVTLPSIDVGMYSILRPDTLELPGNTYPQAQGKNFGSGSASFYTRCVIETITGNRTVSCESAYTNNLQPGQTGNTSYSNPINLSGGLYRAKFTTLLAGDMQSNNNEQIRIFRVIPSGYKDAGVSAIITPMGELQYNNVYYPTIQVRNYSAQAERVPAVIQIKNLQTSQIVYNQNINGDSLQPLTSKVYMFPTPWTSTVGWFEVIARTTLANDQDLTNDTLKAGAICADIDAGVLAINSPGPVVEPTTSVICSVGVINRSWTPKEFNVTLKIGNNYTETKQVSLAAGYNTTLIFDTPWTANPDTYTVRCSTYLAGDMNSANNVKVSSVFVPTRDIQPIVFIAPIGDTIYPDIIIPRVVIQNNGNYRVIAAPVNLKIYKLIPADSLVYDNTWDINIYEGSSRIAYSLEWDPAPAGEGYFRFDVTTLMNPDLNMSNNSISETCYIKARFRDIAVTQIRSPGDTVCSVYPIIPKISVYNNGNVPLAFALITEINKQGQVIYTCTTYVRSPLPPQYSTSVYARACTLSVNGRYDIQSYIIAVDDDSTNDKIDDNFIVNSEMIRDVATARILSPTPGGSFSLGSCNLGAMITNYGNVAADVRLSFKVSKVGGPPNYYTFVQDTLIELPKAGTPGYTQNIVSTVPWVTFAMDTGYYVIKFIADYPDPNQSNNVKVCTVRVYIQPEVGWKQLDAIELTVKDGGALTCVPNFGIYAFPGNKSNAFYFYDIDANNWSQKLELQLGAKTVSKGAALCNDSSNTIYAVRGNNTRDFWAYNCLTNIWTPLESVPPGPGSKPKALKGGSGLAYIKGDPDFIYLVKGSNTDEFYAYNVQTNTWGIKADVHHGYYEKKPNYGTCIATDGRNNIYLLKSKVNELLRYDVLNNIWELKTVLPNNAPGVTKQTKVKPGAALTYTKDQSNVERLYAFKGGNTIEFWTYSIGQNQWTYMNEDMPLAPSNKKINSGGALTTYEGDLYAFKGNKRTDFYKYIPRITYMDRVLSNSNDAVMTAPTSINIQDVKITVTPNLIKDVARIHYQVNDLQPLRIKIYNTNGMLVRNEQKTLSRKNGIFSIDISEIGAGIFFLQIETGNNKFLEKIVVQK